MKNKIAAILMAVGLLGSCFMGCSSTDTGSGKEGQAAEPGQVGEESLDSLPEAASDSQQVQGTIADPGQGTGSGETSETAPGSTPASTPDPTPEPQPEITLVMVGDILLHTRVAESGKLEEGGYDFSAVFDEMRDEIQEADLALVNQEVIIGGEELGISGYPAFNAPYELGDALVEAGFDVVLHATNHAMDKGKRGIVNCLAFWEENYPDIAVLGIHGSEEDKQEIYLYEQDGIKIAILNYTYGTNGIPMPGDMPYAVDMLEREQIISDLQKAEELADFVIVCPHWGTEYTLKETEVQQDWRKPRHES